MIIIRIKKEVGSEFIIELKDDLLNIYEDEQIILTKNLKSLNGYEKNRLYKRLKSPAEIRFYVLEAKDKRDETIIFPPLEECYSIGENEDDYLLSLEDCAFINRQLKELNKSINLIEKCYDFEEPEEQKSFENKIEIFRKSLKKLSEIWLI